MQSWESLRAALLAITWLATIPTLCADQTQGTTEQTMQRGLTLDEVLKLEVPFVESASKYPQPISEAPSSVTIITADEVKKYGHRTLAEILQSVPGLYITYDRNYSFLGSRGVSRGDFNSRVLLLVDGHRVNNDLNDSAPVGTAFPLDVDLIDRVEVVRGPGSVLYGNNAFFGVINVITRQGREMQGIGGEISGEAGGFETYKARITYGHLFTNGVDLLLSGTLYNSEGDERIIFKNFPSNGVNSIAHDMDRDLFGSFFGRISYHDFTLEGAFHEREKRIPTAPLVSVFDDPRMRSVDDRSYVDLKYAHEFTGIADLTARVYYDRNETEIDKPVPIPNVNPVFEDKRIGEWWGADVHASTRLWDRVRVTAGGEFRDDFHQERRTDYQPPVANPSSKERTRQSYGIFGEADIMVLTNLHVNGGVRYDKYGDFDETWNPRVALIYNPLPRSTLKAIYGTAFRAPNFTELIDPRFDLGPEEITSYELIYEQQIGEHLRASVSKFWNRIDDLISFEDGRYTNLNVHSDGVETALEGFLPSSGWRGRVSYTFQETENSDTDNRLTDSPKHLVKFNLSAPVWRDKVFASLEYQYTSTRTSDRTLITGGQTVPGADARGFSVVNFTLFSQNLIKGLEFSASIYNLLDESYADPSTPTLQQDLVPRDGRSFRVKLTYRF